MAAPTNLTIVTTLSTPNNAVVAISSIGGDYSSAVKNIILNGGVWLNNLSGTLVFVPTNSILQIQAS